MNVSCLTNRPRPQASVLMQRLSYPTETVFSNKIPRNIIVLSFKDSPRKPHRWSEYHHPSCTRKEVISWLISPTFWSETMAIKSVTEAVRSLNRAQPWPPPHICRNELLFVRKRWPIKVWDKLCPSRPHPGATQPDLDLLIEASEFAFISCVYL